MAQEKITQINLRSDIELIADLLRLLNEIKKQVSNRIFVNQTAADLVYIYCNQLADKGLAWVLKDRIIQILQSKKEEEIFKLIKETEIIIEKSRKELSLRPFIYPEPKKITKSKAYAKDFLTFTSFKDQIEKTEKEILTNPFQIKLHKPSKGIWLGHLHAHISKNLLLVYLWDQQNRKLIFERIIKHTEFDRG